MENDIEKWAIESTEVLFGEEQGLLSVSELKKWLEERVFNMLNNDFNGLVNLLYRIDVYESKAKDCFGKQNHEIAKCLSELIWERQLEKIKSRKNYK